MGGRGIFAACNWRNEGNNFQTFIKGFFFFFGWEGGCFMRSEGERGEESGLPW